MTYTPGQVLADGLRVDLGSVQFGAVDEAGVAWRVGAEGLQGWDSAEVRAEMAQREGDHGAWPAPVWLGERPVTVAGTITAPDRDALDAAIEALLEAAALDDTVLVVHEAVAKQATVRRSGKPLVQRLTDRVASFSVMMTAADPRRYGTTLHSQVTMLPSSSGGLAVPITPPFTVTATVTSGDITAVNDGSFGTRPVFLVAGPVQQPRVVTQYPDGTIRVLAYSQNLASGDQLVIDTDAHTAILGGTATRRRFLSGQWPEIPPRTSVTFGFRAAVYDPSATLTAQWRSAWI
ncbi:MAG: phage tail family protein [Actinobacteria bacterium]|nr:phage tail family protein [Actinomycetota bacterium]